jgi:ABC-type glucose/galactose transport system permease subunit
VFSHFGHLGDYHGDYAALFIIVMWRIQDKTKNTKKTVLYTCVHKTTHVSGVRTQRRTALIWAFYSLYTHTHKAYLICVSSLSLVCDV